MKNMTSKSSRMFMVILLALVFVYIQHGANEVSSGEANLQNIRYMQAQLVADFSNDELLIGASHNVFVGKVVRRIGTSDRDLGPETHFEVDIIENIKGELAGQVVVNQHGGIKDGLMHVIGDGELIAKPNGKDYLLQPGETYLLATRYNEKENWHTLNFHPNASKLISADKHADKNALKKLSLNDEKVKKLRKAYENEILIEADVKSNNARNSYKSLREKKEAEDGEAGKAARNDKEEREAQNIAGERPAGEALAAGEGSDGSAMDAAGEDEADGFAPTAMPSGVAE